MKMADLEHESGPELKKWTWNTTNLKLLNLELEDLELVVWNWRIMEQEAPGSGEDLETPMIWAGHLGLADLELFMDNKLTIIITYLPRIPMQVL